MSLNWPAFGDALWRVSDELGIRPEWVLPVLYFESAKTFDPAIMNSGKCVGLNQLCPSTYSSYVNVPVSEYRTWSASQQLWGPIFNYWRDQERAYGPIRSSTRLMLAQFGHNLLRTASRLDSVVFAAPSAEYAANCPRVPCSLDPTQKGYITVQDVANVMAYAARAPAVRDAISRAYAMRPWSHPTDPVYGTDFGVEPPPIAVPQQEPGILTTTLTVAALSIAAGFGVHQLRIRARAK